MTGAFCEVVAVLLQALELRLGVAVGNAGIAAQLLVDLLYTLGRDAVLVEDLARRALIAGKGDKQMLGCDIAIPQLACDLDGLVGHSVKPVAHLSHTSTAVGDLGGILDRLGHRAVDDSRICADALDDGREVVFVGVEQRLEQMLAFYRGRLRVRSDGYSSLQALSCGNRHLIHTHDLYLPFLFSVAGSSHALLARLITSKVVILWKSTIKRLRFLSCNLRRNDVT